MKKKHSLRWAFVPKKSRIWSRLAPTFLGVLFLALSCLSLLGPQAAQAATYLRGEKFAWVNGTTIKVTGTSLKSAASLKGSGSPKADSFNLSGDVVTKEGCHFTFSVTDIKNAFLPGTPSLGKGSLLVQDNEASSNKTCNSIYSKYYNYVPPTGSGMAIDISNTQNVSKSGTPAAPLCNLGTDANGQCNDPLTPPAPIPGDDPTDKQIVNVTNNTGLQSSYIDPSLANGSDNNAGGAANERPIHDIFILCGDAKDYNHLVSGWNTTDWFKDCLAQKDGVVVTTQNAPLKNDQAPLIYTAQFTGVKAGYYVMCSVVNNSCVQFTKQPGQIYNVDSFPGGPSKISEADMQKLDGTGADNGASKDRCETTGNPLSWILCPVFNMVGGAADWLFKNILQPFLIVTPISVDPTNPSFQIWSNFRVYGDIFLVIALLVVVFGQSIGGGIVDAYTAKKVLPRLLIAAILINLSIYIVALLVDITNIVGAGLGDLMTAPVRHSSAWAMKMSPGEQLSVVFFTGLIGMFTVGGSLLGIIGGLFFGGTAAITAGLTAAFFVALPVLLAILGVFVTLVLRQGIILLLVLVSPVAFALYCLPNTEQYFKKWWEALIKTLLVYPIVIAVFAIADILSVTMLQSTTPENLKDSNWVAAHSDHLLAVFMAFFLQFLPLFLIPFAFRLAGGLLGRLHGVVTGAGSKLNDMTKARTEQAKHDFGAHTSQARERAYDRLNAGGHGFLARRMGGYNIKGTRAAYNAEQFKQMQAQNDTGDDTEMRALSVNKEWAISKGRKDTDWRFKKDAAGNDTTERQFRTLGGAWVGEADVDRAYNRWGNNQSALQWSIGHEMEKANTQEEQDYLRNNYGNLVGEQGNWSLSEGQKTGVWKGAAFAKQNLNRQWKHYEWNSGVQDLDMGNKNALNMFREIDEKQGSYAMLQQNADTWTTMSQAMEQARSAINSGASGEDRAQAEEILQRGARIAYATRSSSMADQPIPGQGEGDAPQGMMPVAARGGAIPQRQVGAGAAGRVQEEMIRFVQNADLNAGQYQPPVSPDVAARKPLDPGSSYDSLNDRDSDRPGPTPTGTGGSAPRRN